MLSGIPAHVFWRGRRAPTTSRPASAGSQTGLHTHNALFSDTTMLAGSSEKAELDALNSSLACLASLFPDIQLEVFREMLSTFSEESRLQLVAESLLRHREKWVRGRWRVANRVISTSPRSEETPRVDEMVVPTKEKFRSTEYKLAVKAALYQEFKGLSHSAIKAVMAEHNHSYSNCRPALIVMISKSWRFSVTNLFFRRKTPSALDHPLIAWTNTKFGTREPTLIPTTSNELNEELEQGVLADIKSQLLEEQIQQDSKLADILNEKEAELADALFECGCCFSTNPFERITACDSAGHYICFFCVRNAMNEALFGQSWARSIDGTKCSLKCIALEDGRQDECRGSLPRDAVKKALLSGPKGTDTWRRFEERTCGDNIKKSQVPVFQCPFCIYAEAYCNTSPSPCRADSWIPRLCALSILGFAFLPLNPIIGCIIFVATYRFFLRRRATSTVQVTAGDPNHGHKFKCRNPSCLRTSCLCCLAPWVDVHICHQSSHQALRTYMESAVTEAVKRTCPRCNLSFVKSSGCNKLVCVCGYSMCYVCRQDVGQEGYAHFCQHFRPSPGESCQECDRCDLYKTEDEESVIRKAKQTAIAEWKALRRGNREEVDDTLDLEEPNAIQNELRPKRSMFWF